MNSTDGPFLFSSFSIFAYRDHGGGAVIKMAEKDGRAKRMILSFENMTHFVKEMSSLLSKNHTDPRKLDPDSLSSEIQQQLIDWDEHQPELDETELGSFQKQDFKHAFNISNVPPLVAISVADADHQVEEFACYPSVAFILVDRLSVGLKILSDTHN